MEKIISLINDKSVIICNGNYSQRKNILSDTSTFFANKYSGKVITINEYIKNSDRFIKSIRKKFPIRSPLKDVAKYDMTYDQLKDSCFDWLRGKQNILIIIPELQKLYKNEPEHFFEIIGEFLAIQQQNKNNRIRLMISMDIFIDNFISKIPVLIGGDWRPSEKDISIVQLQNG